MKVDLLLSCALEHKPYQARGPNHGSEGKPNATASLGCDSSIVTRHSPCRVDPVALFFWQPHCMSRMLQLSSSRQRCQQRASTLDVGLTRHGREELNATVTIGRVVNTASKNPECIDFHGPQSPGHSVALGLLRPLCHGHPGWIKLLTCRHFRQSRPVYFEAVDEQDEIEMLSLLYTHVTVRCRRKVRPAHRQRHVGCIGGQTASPFRQPVRKATHHEDPEEDSKSPLPGAAGMYTAEC
jgi:hypothetical protein